MEKIEETSNNFKLFTPFSGALTFIVYTETIVLYFAICTYPHCPFKINIYIASRSREKF